MGQVRAELITAGVIACLFLADYLFNNGAIGFLLAGKFIALLSVVAFWQ